ncbi:hypothetical protein RvY_03770 [Ramazzottius varieornatus]|uniref:Uncharacterized protein n=1 Tax=Ramazzottius varieornatus TaxID=947166 RepID=A0A1D1UP90_RAMVA|nr:hypothetical protein RvY_03770 [Ramazzottius varieornatus]
MTRKLMYLLKRYLAVAPRSFEASMTRSLKFPDRPGCLPYDESSSTKSVMMGDRARRDISKVQVGQIKSIFHDGIITNACTTFRKTRHYSCQPFTGVNKKKFFI